jgi:hypothetical protein
MRAELGPRSARCCSRTLPTYIYLALGLAKFLQTHGAKASHSAPPRRSCVFLSYVHRLRSMIRGISQPRFVEQIHVGDLAASGGKDRRNHMAIFRKSGVGKTTLMRNMVVADSHRRQRAHRRRSARLCRVPFIDGKVAEVLRRFGGRMVRNCST